MVFLFVLAVYFASFTLIGLVMGCRYLMRHFGDRRFSEFPKRIQNLNRSYPQRW